MKGETFFEALGKIDKKYTKSAESRFIKSEKRERSANVARIFYYVGTAAALIAVILVIWIPSIILRNKPVEPSVSDTDTVYETKPVTSDEIQTNEPVAETETAPETEPAPENEAEKFFFSLYGKEPDDVEAEEIFFDLERRGLTDEYFYYAAELVAKGKGGTKLQNCTAHFLMIFAEYYQDTYCFNDALYNTVVYNTDRSDAETYYTRLYKNFITHLKSYSATITEDRAKECDYFYTLMKINGVTEWNHKNTPSEAVEASLRSLFDVYDAVFAGIPPKNTKTEPVSEPYGAELEAKIKSFWGGEKRDFVKSSLTLSEYKTKLKKSIQNYTELYIGDTKYFITVGETVYLTAAKDTDKDADKYEYVGIKTINEPSPTIHTVHGTADVLHNGASFVFYYTFIDAYRGEFTNCNNGRFSLTDDVMIYRGDQAVEYVINSMIKSGREDRAYVCTNNMTKTTVHYIMSRYYGETDDNVRGAMGVLLSDVMRIGQYTYTDLLGLEEAQKLTTLSDGTWLSSSTYNAGKSKEMSGWIEKAVTALKNAAKDRYREDIEEYFPVIYDILSEVGFDGYKPGTPDIAFRSRHAVKDALDLLNALRYGIGRYDGTTVVYGNKEISDGRDYPAALAEAIKGKDVDYWGGFATQAEGFKTAEDWKRYYKKILPDDIVNGAIRSTDYFLIVDGAVYTAYDEGWNGIYEINLTELKAVGKKDGVSVLSVDIMIPHGMGCYRHEVTFEVKEDKNGVKIVGGTFAEIFLETGTTKGKAALTVFELLRIKEMLVDGNGNFADFCGHYSAPLILETAESLTEYYKNDYYAGPVPDLTKVNFPVYAYSGWSDDNSWEWEICKVLPEEYYDMLITFNGRLLKAGSYVLIPSGDGKAELPVIGSAADITLTDVYNAIKIRSDKNGKMTVSLDFSVKENGKAKTVSYTFALEDRGSITLMTVGGTFKDRFFDFRKTVDPEKLIRNALDVIRLSGSDDTYSTGDNAAENVPKELIDAAYEQFGEQGRYQTYMTIDGISPLNYLRKKAAKYFADDAVKRMYDDNRKMFVPIDKKLYINTKIGEIACLEVSEITRFEKAGENKYEIGLVVCNSGELNPEFRNLTAKIEIISGKVVVTGGTFLDFIFEEMLAK